MHERDFQAGFIKKVRKLFPGCIILKNDSGYMQGVPDLTILFLRKWAIVEVKRSVNEAYEPNQEWYLDEMNKMSFGRTVYPENEEEILNALQSLFRPRRAARISQCQ